MRLNTNVKYTNTNMVAEETMRYAMDYMICKLNVLKRDSNMAIFLFKLHVVYSFKSFLVRLDVILKDIIRKS